MTDSHNIRLLINETISFNENDDSERLANHTANLKAAKQELRNADSAEERKHLKSMIKTYQGRIDKIKNNPIDEDRQEDPDVSYEEKLTKGVLQRVIVKLKGRKSERATRLADKYKEVKDLTETLSNIKDELNKQTKEFSTDYFNDTDRAYTRVIESIKFIMTFSKIVTKEAGVSKTVAYDKIFEELTETMPDIIDALRALEKKHTTSKDFPAKTGAERLSVKFNDAGNKTRPTEKPVKEAGLLGQGTSKSARAADVDQSDREYIAQRKMKKKWKQQNPGQQWPGYKQAKIDLSKGIKEETVNEEDYDSNRNDLNSRIDRFVERKLQSFDAKLENLKNKYL